MKLQFEQVSKSFKDKKVLKDISVTMDRGVYGLLGPNGAGKTTMMRIMADTMPPSKGRILIDGKDYKDCGDEYRETNYDDGVRRDQPFTNE
ncbi:ATP-binding cassette domain-containing protein [Alkaliphilus metalliredigens]|nr:ATP-binding cassette domain-containing protein [Alkaliphilus metalliredigens]